MNWIGFWLLQLLMWGAVYVFSAPEKLRERKWLPVLAAVISAAVLSLIYYWVHYSNTAELQLLLRSVSFLSVLVLNYVCWEVSVSIAVYNGIWAISVWQLLVEVWTITYNMNIDKVVYMPVRRIAFMILFFTLAYTLLAKTVVKWLHENQKNKLGPRQMISACLIFLIVEMLSYSPMMRNVAAYSLEWKFIFLSQFICLVLIYLQNEMFKKSRLQEELAIMNVLIKKGREQYLMSKESIALINQKSHDLKHQIRALRNASKEEIDSYLDELEESVKIYEAIVHTGNEVLDTILTEKSLYCKDREIQITCVADGSQMDFIHRVDLYAILGNTLDNAIEAVGKFAEKEKRQIDVKIYRQQNFLVIHIINPMPEELIYEEELPVTTKDDKKFHGFGLRSVKHIVKQYDGFLNISEEDECFSLKIMMPIPKGRQNV